MTHFKLIFNRFMEAEGITIPINMDTSGLSAGRQKVTSETNAIVSQIDKVVDANERLAKVSSDKRTGKIKLAEAGINRFNAAKDLVSKQASNSHISPKTRGNLSGLLSVAKSKGLDNLKTSQAASMDANKVSSMQSLGGKLSTAGMKAATEEQKYWNDAAKEGIKYLQANAKEALKTQNAMNKYANGIQQAANKTKNADNETSKFTQTMKKLAGAAVRWRILYGAFSRIWNILSSTVDKAAAYEEAINLYRVALGSYADEATEWANKISTALYLDPRYVMQYTGALYNLVQGLGVSEKAAYKMSTNLTQLAYDMSSYLNIDVQAAYDKIQSAMTGQSRAVASAGIAMQQASLQELAYSMGIKKLVSEMTQAEKTYLRYIQIMRSTTKMQGDLGRTIVTPENALRIIRQQFEMLARAIGQIFIPIIMKAIPYVMALTQILTELAKTLASSLGFELAKIDYGSITTADTHVEDAFNNMSNSASKGSKSIKDSINRTLAAFDELNVVESESSGSGGGGVGGLGGSPGSALSNLEPYIDGYDMLKDLTADMDTKVAQARENLLKFWEVLKKVGKAFLIFKAIKGLSQLALFADNIKDLYVNGKGLPGLFKKMVGPFTTLISKFKEGYAASFALGNKGLTAVGAGLRNVLGPIGTFVGGLLTVVGSFASAMKIMSDFDGTSKTLLKNLTLSTVAVSGLTAVAFALGGPFTAGAAAIAGVVGALAGLSAGIEKYKRELEAQERYDHLFDGMGVSITALTDNFDKQTQKIIEYTKEMSALSDKISTTTANVNTARDSLQELTDKITLGNFDSKETILAQLQDATENFKTKIEESKQAHIDYTNKIVENMKEQGTINKVEYDSMRASAEQYYTWLTGSQHEYAVALAALDKQLVNGEITQEEYNKKIQELNDKYTGVIKPIKNAAQGLDDMYYIAASKIDLSSPEEVYDLVTRLKKSYDEGSKSLELQKQKATDTYQNEKREIEELLAPLQRKIDKGEELSKKEQETYDKQMGRLTSLKTEYNNNMEAIEHQSEQLGGTYKNYLATIYGQISEAGKLTDADVKNTVDTIGSEMDRLVKFDTKKSTTDLFGRLTENMYTSGKTFETNTIKTFAGWGIKFTDTLSNSLSSGTEKAQKQHEKDLEKFSNNNTRYFNNNIIPKYGDIGKKAIDKYTYGAYEEFKIKEKDWNKIGSNSTGAIDTGMWSEVPTLKKSAATICDDTTKTCKTALQINSPSKVFMSIGASIIEGLQKGLTNNETGLLKYIGNLVNKIKSKAENTSVSLKFDATSDLEKSFNKILAKEQSFVNKWRNGINDLLSNTKKAFAGIALGPGSVLTYSAMKNITISKFAEGGYPTSGDLFLANENGNAEYITSLGNRTAVANQDQMVKALTNAILQGMSAIETNRQPGITQVYIGNEKVYEGQGQYQNRQADRWGTNYIKI